MNITDVNLSIVLGILLLIEQILAQVPTIKSNSTFQLACNITDAVVKALKNLCNVTPALPVVVQQAETIIKGVVNETSTVSTTPAA